QAATVFVAAAVHCALMVMSLKLVSALTSGWQLPLGTARPQTAGRPAPAPAVLPAAPVVTQVLTNGRSEPLRPAERDDRVRSVVAAVSVPAAHHAPETGGRVIHLPGAGTVAVQPFSSVQAPAASLRARDVGRSVRSAASSQSIKETLA
ncbi:MAG: hypothetical protein QM605_03095, partial [Sphingobium sp.]